MSSKSMFAASLNNWAAFAAPMCRDRQVPRRKARRTNSRKIDACRHCRLRHQESIQRNTTAQALRIVSIPRHHVSTLHQRSPKFPPRIIFLLFLVVSFRGVEIFSSAILTGHAQTTSRFGSRRENLRVAFTAVSFRCCHDLSNERLR